MVNLERPGTYVLVMKVTETRMTQVGALGTCVLHEGWYLYVGSAMGGLGHRLRRHARQAKRNHWHIDYVLECAELVEAWVHVGRERLECDWAGVMRDDPGLTPFPKPLGASDCACPTHLFHSGERPCVTILKRDTGSDDLVVVSVAALRDPKRPANPG